MKFVLLILIGAALFSNTIESRNILSKYFESDFVIDIERSYEFRQNDRLEVEYYSICKGTIVAPKKIVTSGDCLESSDSIYKTEYRNLTIKHKNTRYAINNVYSHAKYKNDSLANNVAILEIDKSIVLSKYPTFISKSSLLSMIASKEKAHILFQDKDSATIQSAVPISNAQCSLFAKSEVHDSMLCLDYASKDVVVCPSFQGSPITRVVDNGSIELVGIIPRYSSDECQSVKTILSINVAFLKYFLDDKKHYVQNGALSIGYIQSLSKGWHFLGTQERIDESLSYILDDAKKIYIYENSASSYKMWIKINDTWNTKIDIPARSGFWIKR